MQDFSSYKWDLPARMIFLGRSKSGKTVLLKEFIRTNASKFEKIFVYLGSDNDDYAFIDPKYIFKDITKIDKLLEIQDKNKNTPICLIIDDFIGSNLSASHNNSLDAIFSRGRHKNITICVLTQYINKLSTTQRDNAGYIIITKCGGDTFKGLVKYQDKFTSEKTLYADYLAKTKLPFTTMMINNNDSNDSIVYFKKVNMVNFKIKQD